MINNADNLAIMIDVSNQVAAPGAPTTIIIPALAWVYIACTPERVYVTGSGQTRLLEQTKILVINVPSDRAEHCLHNDMLSVHIPSFIPELCALET